jgi:glycosyltransferase involved in cell wall biosynthesis
VKRLRDSGWTVLLNEMPIGHLALVPGWDSAVVDWCEVPCGPIARWVAHGAAQRFRMGTVVDEGVAGGLRPLAPNSRFVTVRTPVDLDRYAPGPKDPGLVLFVGRLVPHKGVENLGEAVERLRAEGRSDLRCWIVGDGPLRERLEARFAGSEAVRLLGAVSEERKVELMRRAWVLGIPSRREGLPNAILESVATLTPILTAQGAGNGASAFVERHGVGLVADDDRPESLVAALRACTDARLEASARAESRLRSEFATEPNLDRLEAVLLGRWAA